MNTMTLKDWSARLADPLPLLHVELKDLRVAIDDHLVTCLFSGAAREKVGPVRDGVGDGPAPETKLFVVTGTNRVETPILLFTSRCMADRYCQQNPHPDSFRIPHNGGTGMTMGSSPYPTKPDVAVVDGRLAVFIGGAHQLLTLEQADAWVPKVQSALSELRRAVKRAKRAARP